MKEGTLEDGTWEVGTWEGGSWKDGTLECGTLEDGKWVGGCIWSEEKGEYIYSDVSPKDFRG